MILVKRDFDYIKKMPPGQEFMLSLDFEQGDVKVVKGVDKAVLDGNLPVDLKQIIKDKFCYLLDGEGIMKISFFSEKTNRFYKLLPAPDWPTFSISSVPMHKLSSPKKDTEAKIGLVKPYGLVIDTCMGLGYTAILASKKARKVITFERDKNVIALARLNPVSSPLFESKNIEIRGIDVLEGIKEIRDGYCDCIIHDPPTFKIASELFSEYFYQQLKRILKVGGKLFHYAPLYKIRQNVNFPLKIQGKLKKVGFRQIKYSASVGGLLCLK